MQGSGERLVFSRLTEDMIKHYPIEVKTFNGIATYHWCLLLKHQQQCPSLSLLLVVVL
jgi:hypothetical protein